MVLVWWPLPECPWKLEGRLVDSVLVSIAGVHGGWRGLELVLIWWPLPKCPWRLEGRLVDSFRWPLPVSTEAGGASSWFCSGGFCRCPRRLEGASSWCWSGGHCRSVHGD